MIGFYRPSFFKKIEFKYLDCDFNFKKLKLLLGLRKLTFFFVKSINKK